MNLQEIITQLNDREGPNIPTTTLAIYCGTAQSTISRIKNGLYKPSDALEQQIRQGLKELAQEITNIANS